MIKGKKLAMKFRDKPALLVKKDDKKLWVSDTHALIALDKKQGQYFINKYNSYKSTPYIPEIGKERTFVKDINKHNIKEEDTIGNLIQNYQQQKLSKARLYNFCYRSRKKNYRIYKHKHGVGLIADEYSFIFEKISSYKLYCPGLNEPLILKDSSDEEIKALVMPLRCGDDLIDDLKNLTELTELAG